MIKRIKLIVNISIPKKKSKNVKKRPVREIIPKMTFKINKWIEYLYDL